MYKRFKSVHTPGGVYFLKMRYIKNTSKELVNYKKILDLNSNRSKKDKDVYSYYKSIHS